MLRKLGLFWFITVVFVLVVSQPVLAAYDVGDTAANFTVKINNTNTNVSLYDYAGHIIVLDFFAYWCGPCKTAASEMEPYIQQYYHDLGGNPASIPVIMISINIESGAVAETDAYIAKYGLETVWDDFYWVAFNAFGTGPIPQITIVNGVAGTNYGQWEVLKSQLGYGSGLYTTFRSIIDAVQYTSGNTSGSLQVTLNPSEAVSAGAQWNVDGGAWQSSGDTAGDLSAGVHTVNYKAIDEGWITPPSEQVTITAGQTTQLTRTYSYWRPGVYYVDDSAVGNNNGMSWGNAFTELQSALGAAVADDEIRVAGGTYLPDPNGLAEPREASFALKNGVAVRGGYAGYGTTDPDERDIELYETILSGDLLGNDNPATTVEELLGDPSLDDNCYHVFYHPDVLGLDPNAVLDGFTITAGSNSQNGAGMYNSNSSPTVTNCTFKWNCAEWGAGMANWNSSPKVTGCKFENNAAGGGGGMNNMENSNPILIDCTFSNNFGSWMGGGMVNGYAGLHGSANPTLINCTFTGNSAERGGGMYNAEESNPTVTNCTFSSNSLSHGFGGGMYNNNSDPEVMGCTFVGNSCDAGGGMYNYQDSSPIVSDCTFTGNLTMMSGSGMFNEDSSPRVTNCTFSDNSSLIGSGGGMFNASSRPEVISCIFSGNSARHEGGGMFNKLSSPTVANCTFSGNLGGQCGGGMYNEEESNPTVTYCIFLDNTAEYGGGMYNKLDSSPTVTNSTFNDNSAEGGGGMYNRDDSSPTVTGCVFSGNSANRDGGGMGNYFSSRPIITNCIFSCNSAGYDGGGMRNQSGSPTVADCIFIGNSAVSEGGGMSNMRCSPTVVNCTFSGNSADRGGGMYSNRTSSIPVVSNCILWGNTAISGDNEIYGDPVISYSDIEGSGGSGAGWDSALGTDGGGNIDVDPMFVRNPDDGGDGWGDDPATGGVDEGANDDHGDLRLQSGSLCIEAGDNGAVTEATDLDGLERIVDGDCDGASVVDMGAYEFDWLYLGDFAGGCDVDLMDFAVLAENWQGSNAGVDIAPYHEGDGVIDLGELMVLAENWLECYTAPEPLDVSLDIDGSWIYQNLPGQTGSNLTAAVSVTGDASGNSSYSYQWDIISPSDVTVGPVTVSGGGSGDEVWSFAAGGCDEVGSASDSGQVFTVKVTVTGNLGNTGSAEMEFGIALLGDVNNDHAVNVADRSIINAFWRNGSAGVFTLADCDVNCDGAVNVADRSITNAIWRGLLGSNSITTPCPLR